MGDCCALNPASILLESITMSVVSVFLIITNALTRENNAYTSTGLILVILACAYGIPGLKIKDPVTARKFSITAAVFATLCAILFSGSLILGLIGAISLVNDDQQLARLQEELHLMIPQDKIVLALVIGFGFLTALIIATCLLSAKHIKNSAALGQRSRAQQITFLRENQIDHPSTANMNCQTNAQSMVHPPPYPKQCMYP